MAGEKGASTCLTVLPLKCHGFALHKGAFRDALCLRYGWLPPHISSHCVCGSDFTVEHSLQCKHGGFPSMRHNEVRDITAHLLTETSHNVMVEPPLQELTGELLHHRSANIEDGARVDVAVHGFWNPFQRSFFDVGIFSPFAPTYSGTHLSSVYRRHEMEKRRCYDERIWVVEMGSFSPLVFSSSGGMGPSATTFYKHLASLIADRNDQPYSRVLYWIRCRLGFSLLRSSIVCLRRARSSHHRPIIFKADSGHIDLALSESGRVT